MGDSADRSGSNGDRQVGSDAGLERLSRRVTLLGTVIAALVAMNSALTTCTNDTAARYAGFRQAVAAEEVFWKELYNDYLNVFGKELTQEQKQAKLFAISALADRQVPRFTEYRLGLLDDSDAKLLAIARLELMQSKLREALDRKESSDPALVQARQDQYYAVAEASRLQARSSAAGASAGLAPADRAVPQPASATLTYETQVLSKGSPKGWDLDVFWCAGGGRETELLNYGVALDKARRLASASATDLVRGVKVGRVRVRVLPETRQGTDARGINHPSLGEGNRVRAEAAERAAAEAVLRFINQPTPTFSYFQSETRTPWYFSLFACSGPFPAVGTTGPAATAAS